MFENFSAWKANTSVFVGIVVFAVGVLIFGREGTELESSVVLWVSFGAAIGTNFLLHHREDRDDRARERAARGRSRVSRESSAC